MKINCPKCNAEIEASDLNFWGCSVCAPNNGSVLPNSTESVSQKPHKDDEDNWFAFDPVDDNYMTFPTEEKAREWLEYAIEVHRSQDDEIDEEFVLGKGVIGKIMYRTHFTVTDRKKDFCSKGCENCGKDPDTCGEEAWCYGDNEEIGVLSIIPVPETKTAYGVK